MLRRGLGVKKAALFMRTPLSVIALEEASVPMICPNCKARTDQLEAGEYRTGDILISKELLLRMLNLEDASCLSIRYEVERDILVLRVVQTGPEPQLWFQDLNLPLRAEGAEYQQQLIGD